MEQVMPASQKGTVHFHPKTELLFRTNLQTHPANKLLNSHHACQGLEGDCH